MIRVDALTQLNHLLRGAKGAKGFIENQDVANQVAIDAYSEIFQPAGALGLDLIQNNQLEMGKFATATEIQVREHEKLQSIARFQGGTHLSGVAEDYQAEAIRSAHRARTALAKASAELKNPATKYSALRDVFATNEMKGALDHAGAVIERHLSELNITPEGFNEIRQVWKEVAAVSDSADNLIAYWDSSLDAFVTRRQSPTRGTEHHSPLPWWKWLLIAAVFCAMATAIAACVIYFGCALMERIIVATVFALLLIWMAGC